MTRGRGQRFRKRPVVIEALQVPWKGIENDEYAVQWGQLMAFLHTAAWNITEDLAINIKTLEGVMRAEPGDWIICGVKGEYYPCKPEIFAATYEAVDEDARIEP